jgi:hypothetical protein
MYMDAATVSTIAAAIGAAVTAVATIALWRVTKVLANETTRMADATGQPQIVATLRPNPWTLMYAQIAITNSGNASAFDVTMVFDPPLIVHYSEQRSENRPLPFQKVSILRPGETLSSHVGKSFPLLEKTYWVTTSWLRHPQDIKRHSLSYTLSMADVQGLEQLGGGDPLVQIAQEIKHIREDWRGIASANRRTRTDVYTAADRLHERRENERSRRAWNRQIEEQRLATGAEATEADKASDSTTPLNEITPTASPDDGEGQGA